MVAPLARMPVPDRPRDLVARRELLDEALAVGVVKRRALAADRLGDEEALAARDAGRPRWGGTARTPCPRAPRRRRARAACRCPSSRAGSSCAPTAPRRRRSRGSSRARRHGRPSSQTHADAAAVGAPQRARRAWPPAPDAGVRGDERGELAHDAAAGGAAAGVDDAAARVAALEPEREVAVAVGVEAHAEPLEVARRLAGASSHEDSRGRPPQRPRPARSVSAQVQLGRVVGGERRGDPALRPVAGGLGQRRGARRARRAPPRAAAVSAA